MMAVLVVTEKPSVAQSIARVIGAGERKDGYMEGNGYLVSWCIGHLVELAQPDAYSDAWKKWDYAKISRAEIVLLLVILFVILPLINITSEEIAIDTDQGAYFLHTCTLMEEKSKEIHFLQEIGKISEEVDNGIRELTNDLKCYYHEKNEDIFYIHALGSWC